MSNDIEHQRACKQLVDILSTPEARQVDEEQGAITCAVYVTNLLLYHHTHSQLKDLQKRTQIRLAASATVTAIRERTRALLLLCDELDCAKDAPPPESQVLPS